MKTAKSKRNGRLREGEGAQTERRFAYHTWEVPGLVRAELYLNVVDQIAQEISDDADEATDTVGILLGRRVDSGSRLILIEDYAALTGRRGVDGGYSDADKTAFERLLDRWRPSGTRRMEPLGFYRTSVAGVTAPRNEDMALLQDYFPDTDALFLLVTCRRGRKLGRLAFREGFLGAPVVTSESFPFSPDELTDDVTDFEMPAISHGRDMSRLPRSREWPWFNRRAGWLIGGAVAAGLLALGIVEYRALPVWETATNRQGASPQDNAWIDLRAERVGSQWQLRWNRNARILQSASRGRLQIVDGDYHKDMALDATDLQGGYLIYAPLTDEVSFRLEIFDTAHDRTFGESVRVAAGGLRMSDRLRALASNPYLLPDDSLSSPRGSLSSAPADGSRFGRGREERYTRRNSRPEERSNELPIKPPARQVFVPPGLQEANTLTVGRIAAPGSVTTARTAGPEPATLPLAPGTGTVATGPLPDVLAKAATGAQAPPPPRPVEPPPAAPVMAAAKPAETMTPAVLVRSSPPEYPKAARDMRLSGVVEVAAVVDVNGNTSNVRAVSGPLLLREAAIKAVKSFVFQPATLHGKPVESTASVGVRFKLE